jgi:hypothetical protein
MCASETKQKKMPFWDMYMLLLVDQKKKFHSLIGPVLQERSVPKKIKISTKAKAIQFFKPKKCRGYCLFKVL